jgi:hypothetical protein
MAILFLDKLMRVSDFVKISDRYSSAQSVSRAKIKGRLPMKNIGGMSFAFADAVQVSKAYSIASWEGLQVIDANRLPRTLEPINRIGKTIGVGEASMIEWALFNRIDAYWIGGTFFAELSQAKQLAPAKKK